MALAWHLHGTCMALAGDAVAAAAAATASADDDDDDACCYNSSILPYCSILVVRRQP